MIKIHFAPHTRDITWAIKIKNVSLKRSMKISGLSFLGSDIRRKGEWELNNNDREKV